MIISISNAVQATQIFTIIFIVAILVSVRRRKNPEFFSTEISQELKGLAILMVVFSHIGYFLVSDNRFLVPLSTMAGVGVNLFLFLSGFGLVASSIRKKYSTLEFYKRRIIKLLIPYWVVVTSFFLLDYFVLHHFYSWGYIGQTMLGFVAAPDLYRDLNSPLWYIALILFYYVIFPLLFSAKRPWLSAIIIYLISYAIVRAEPVMLYGVLHLYKIHLIAFPLGMLFSSVYCQFDKVLALWLVFKQYILKLVGRTARSASSANLMKNRSLLRCIGSYLFMLLLLGLIGYTVQNANIGGDTLAEELTSLVSMSAIVILFLVKKFDLGLFYIVGVYSYEIYLLHWPILYHYDFIYKFLPAWLATALYLVFFVVLGFALNKLIKTVSGKVKSVN